MAETTFTAPDPDTTSTRATAVASLHYLGHLADRRFRDPDAAIANLTGVLTRTQVAHLVRAGSLPPPPPKLTRARSPTR